MFFLPYDNVMIMLFDMIMLFVFYQLLMMEYTDRCSSIEQNLHL